MSAKRRYCKAGLEENIGVDNALKLARANQDVIKPLTRAPRNSADWVCRCY